MSEGLIDSTIDELKYALITPEALSRIAFHASAARFKKFFPHLTATMHRYEIDRPLRQAHWLAELMHESGEFWYVSEIADGSAYEGRKDLGNTEPGDGKRFKGRGLMQLTGRANYAAYSKYAGIDFIQAPELLTEPRHAVDVSGWFWYSRGLNAYADRDDVFQIAKRINGLNRLTGKPNGYEKRREYLARAKGVLGA